MEIIPTTGLQGPMIVYGADREVMSWVGDQLGWRWDEGSYTAVGIARNRDLIGGVVYSGYCSSPHMVEASIVARGRWANRTVLSHLFGVPFLQYRVSRLQTRVKRYKTKVKNFNERLGFHYEGVMREGWPLGGDAWVFSMMKSECRWILPPKSKEDEVWVEKAAAVAAPTSSPLTMAS